MKKVFIRGLLLLMVLSLTSAYIGISAQPETTTPDWLIRSDPSFNLVGFDVFTNEGEVAQDEFYEEFVGFSLDTAAYIYIFSVSAPAENGSRAITMLLPNSIDTDNFYEAGEYTISPEFIIEDEPVGTAYIQAFATPYPINVSFSTDQTFTYQGTDPDLFFRGIQFDIQSQGVLSTEYAADWVSYAVRGGGIEAFSAGSRCTKIRINVPEAEGMTVRFTVDANCVNGASLAGEFEGPTSKKIAQVLEGERTITVSIFGYEDATTTGVAEFGRTTEFTISPEVPEPSYGILASNVAPRIYEEVVFTPNIQTFRPISNYLWDFGDGTFASFTTEEFEEMGGSVTHAYSEGSGTTELGDPRPYRVTLTVQFSDGQTPTDEIADLALPVSDKPLPGTCPPSSVISQEFARSILLESSSTGCATIPVPSHLVDTSALTHEGPAELINQFNWESMPSEARVQALLFVIYRDADDVSLGQQRFSMLKESTGFFTIDPVIDIPDGATVDLELSLNVIDNPSAGRVALEAGPFELSSITNCSSARLYPRNDSTDSQGDGISFRIGTDVRIFFENTGCAAIALLEGTIVIKRNGETVANIINSGDTVGTNRIVNWTWNQTDSNGNQVPQGNYTVEIQTDQGEYTSSFKILN